MGSIDLSCMACCNAECPCATPPDILFVSVTGSCISSLFPAQFDTTADQLWESAELEAAGVCCVQIVNAQIACAAGKYFLTISMECTDPDTGDPITATYTTELTIESCSPVLWTASGVASTGGCGGFCDLGPIDIEVTE